MTLEPAYICTGGLLVSFSWLTWTDVHHPRRHISALFWLLLGLLFALGSWLPTLVNGFMVLLLVVLDAIGLPPGGDSGHPETRAPLGDRVVLPVLLIPLSTLVGTLICWGGGWDMSRGGLLGMALGSLLGMALSLVLTRGSPMELLQAGRQVNATIGAVSILPQLLAALGIIFAAAQIGPLLAQAVQAVVPPDHKLGLVLANCLGMSLLAALTGNSFAAFPVIVGGILVPLLIKPLGADPAALGILTLSVGASGTLSSPMAANFNLVPAALLGIRDPYAVVKFQIPVAIAMWLFQVALMWALLA